MLNLVYSQQDMMGYLSDYKTKVKLDVQTFVNIYTMNSMQALIDLGLASFIETKSERVHKDTDYNSDEALNNALKLIAKEASYCPYLIKDSSIIRDGKYENLPHHYIITVYEEVEFDTNIIRITGIDDKAIIPMRYFRISHREIKKIMVNFSDNLRLRPKAHVNRDAIPYISYSGLMAIIDEPTFMIEHPMLKDLYIDYCIKYFGDRQYIWYDANVIVVGFSEESQLDSDAIGMYLSGTKSIIMNAKRLNFSSERMSLAFKSSMLHEMCHMATVCFYEDPKEEVTGLDMNLIDKESYNKLVEHNMEDQIYYHGKKFSTFVNKVSLKSKIPFNDIYNFGRQSYYYDDEDGDINITLDKLCRRNTRLQDEQKAFLIYLDDNHNLFNRKATMGFKKSIWLGELGVRVGVVSRDISGITLRVKSEYFYKEYRVHCTKIGTIEVYELFNDGHVKCIHKGIRINVLKPKKTLDLIHDIIYNDLTKYRWDYLKNK